jgi:putative salt-induced outer membrane protein YdiY
MLLAVAWLTIGPRPTQAQQIIQLINGDRLSGTLKEIRGDVWTFEHPTGQMSVPVASVTRFTALDPIGLRLHDRTVIAARVLAPGDRELLLSAPGGYLRSIAPEEIRAVGEVDQLEQVVPPDTGYFSPILKYWGATVALGFSDKSGNSRARGLTVDLNTSRETAKDRLNFKAGLSREEARLSEGGFETTVDKYYGSARADVFFGSRFFLFGFTRHERDVFQQIELRSKYDAGFGLQLVARTNTDLRVYSSGGARVEAFTSGGDALAWVWTAGAEFRETVGPARFTWTMDFAPNVEDFSDYQLRSDAAVMMTVFKGIGFRIGLLNELNSQPQPGVEPHDMLVSSTLTYSIGR